MCLTAVWCVLSVLLYMHMSAQLNESPELTADGALWVGEACSVRSACSPCNLSSFSFSVFSPKTTEETLDHHPLCHHLPLCRGMSACSALGFYPGSLRQLVDVQFRQGSMGHFLMMWFSDKPGKTDWLTENCLGAAGKAGTRKRSIVDRLPEEGRVSSSQKFNALNF